jgi:signal peptidase
MFCKSAIFTSIWIGDTYMNTTQTREKRPNKAASAIALVLCIVFGFILVCNLTIIIKGSVHPERPPSVFGVTPLVVLSGSMSGEAEDHIEIGDLIFSAKVAPSELTVGDIISFMDGESVVTHRITAISHDETGKLQFTTKGDANNAEDLRSVSEDNVVGVFKCRIGKVGDFALFLQTPLGMVLFIALPMLGFIIYDILRRRHYALKEDKRTAELEAELERLRALAGEKREE